MAQLQPTHCLSLLLHKTQGMFPRGVMMEDQLEQDYQYPMTQFQLGEIGREERTRRKQN